MGQRPFFVLYVLVCLEIGIFLMLVPWSAVWERNYFLEAMPALRPFVTAPWFRGAVAGLGVANLYMAFAEIGARRQAIEEASSSDEGLEERERSDRRESSRPSWVASKD